MIVTDESFFEHTWRGGEDLNIVSNFVLQMEHSQFLVSTIKLFAPFVVMHHCSSWFKLLIFWELWYCKYFGFYLLIVLSFLFAASSVWRLLCKVVNVILFAYELLRDVKIFNLLEVSLRKERD